MKILALDAATEACSVALLIDDAVREEFVVAPREHAQRLLPMTRGLLAEAECSLNALDAIAVGRGPGAFTGVRIAMSMAQGLALGAERPIAPVSNLAALALRTQRQHGRERDITRTLVVNDARMGELYWALYAAGADGRLQTVEAEQISQPDALVQRLAETGLQADAIAGNGWAAYAEALAPLQQRLGCEPLEPLPHAEDIARLGALRVADGQTVDAAAAEPVYVRDNVARKPGKN